MQDLIRDNIKNLYKHFSCKEQVNLFYLCEILKAYIYTHPGKQTVQGEIDVCGNNFILISS